MWCNWFAELELMDWTMQQYSLDPPPPCIHNYRTIIFLNP